MIKVVGKIMTHESEPREQIGALCNLTDHANKSSHIGFGVFFQRADVAVIRERGCPSLWQLVFFQKHLNSEKGAVYNIIR